MKTQKYHTSNLGKFAPTEHSDRQGYVTYHDSPRYTNASNEQLQEWLESRSALVRAAAATEIAERDIAAWRKSN